MSQIDYSFLKTGLKWDLNQIQNMGFNFADSTPLYLYAQFDFLDQFSNLGNNFSFSASSDPSIFDQQDVIRYFLLDPSRLDDLTNDATINSVLVNSVDYRVSFSDIISSNFLESVNGQIQLVNHEGENDRSRSWSTPILESRI